MQFDLNKFLEIVKILVPVVIAIVDPSLAPTANLITQAIGEAEQVGGTGPEKKAHAMTLVNSTIDLVNQAQGHQAVVMPVATDTVSQVIDQTIAAANHALLVRPK